MENHRPPLFENDQLVLNDFRNGSEDAFATLYAKHRQPIFRFVRARITHEEVATELTQEIFLKVYRFRETFQDGYSFTSWLWTITRNTITDHLRGAPAPAFADIAAEEIPSTARCPEAVVLRKDRKRSFIKMIGKLTRPQKRVLWLRVVKQLSYPEISKKLGISLSAAKNLALRGRTSLAGSDFAPLAT